MKTPFLITLTAGLTALSATPSMAASPQDASPTVAALPSTRLEAGELAITGPAEAPAYLIIGPAIPQRRLAGGVLLDVAPEELVPFRFDEEGSARLSVPASAAEPGALVQVIAFDQRRSQAVSVQPPMSLDLGQAGALNALAGPGFTLGAAQGGVTGELGGQVTCNSYCATCDDSPDGSFADTNCDGIDGDKSRALFVDTFSGLATNDGSMGNPLNDLQLAIDMAYATPGVDHVYVSQGDYAGPITLADGVSVWGGYDAADGWSRASDHPVIIHNIDAYESPEGISGLRGANLFTPMVVGDLHVEAWGNGYLLGGDGDHAFAIHLYNVSGLRLERVSAVGAFADHGLAGVDQGLVSGHKLGGSGGSGGTSGHPTGYLGSGGNGTSCGFGGIGGLGGLPYFGGGDGSPGVLGLPGAWGSTKYNSISISGPNLIASGNGTDGSSGCYGGGGGGGGGGGYALFVGNGGKGGKGGNGGKAGKGGKGGKRGGCSVGLFLSSAKVEAVGCVFLGDVAGWGGVSGTPGGGTGGAGGSKGQSVSGPNGGDGGTGGPGGIGGFAGGGSGGHSYGILASSNSSVSLQGTSMQATTGGLGGLGILIGYGGEAVPFKQL